jgi:hypothetical protein
MSVHSLFHAVRTGQAPLNSNDTVLNALEDDRFIDLLDAREIETAILLGEMNGRNRMGCKAA